MRALADLSIDDLLQRVDALRGIRRVGNVHEMHAVEGRVSFLLACDARVVRIFSWEEGASLRKRVRAGGAWTYVAVLSFSFPFLAKERERERRRLYVLATLVRGCVVWMGKEQCK